eukprot:g17077.t1
MADENAIAKLEAIANLTQTVAQLQKQVDHSFSSYVMDINNFWIIVGAILVVWMQAGFGMLEAGGVRAKNVSNILFKNLMEICTGAIVFWAVGYAFAFGEPSGAFIGYGNFALSRWRDGYSEYPNPSTGEYVSQYPFFFFQMTFAATGASIISGAVAERCAINAYFIYSLFVVGWIYPVIAHWVWSHSGWLSAFNSDPWPCGSTLECNGMIDFAGSGVVHLVGGCCALVAAYMIGPRAGRFTKDRQGNTVVNPIPGHSNVLTALGTFILWMGWYGFNGASALCMAKGCSNVVGKVMVNTTLSPSFAGWVTCLISKAKSHYDVPHTCNGILAGLVAVTAGCGTVEPWGACAIGTVAAFVYMGAVHLIENILYIDDPLCAIAIHCFNGAWGLLAVGIFSSDQGIAWAYGRDNNGFSSGLQLLTQFVGMVCIAAWSFSTCALLFFCMGRVMELRVSVEKQKTGLDLAEHGGAAYNPDQDVDADQDEARELEQFKAQATNPDPENREVIAPQ